MQSKQNFKKYFSLIMVFGQILLTAPLLAQKQSSYYFNQADAYSQMQELGVPGRFAAIENQIQRMKEKVKSIRLPFGKTVPIPEPAPGEMSAQGQTAQSQPPQAYYPSAYPGAMYNQNALSNQPGQGYYPEGSYYQQPQMNPYYYGQYGY